MKSNTATWNREDRDLLVELRTTLSQVQGDIKEIKDGTATKLTFLENDKLSRAEAVRLNTENLLKHSEFDDQLKDLKTRVSALEESRIVYRTTIRTWLIVCNVVWALIGLGVAIYFH